MTKVSSNSTASPTRERANCDLQALKDALPTLEEKARIAIYFRFWECMTIQQIAKALGLSWDATDQLIKDSLLFLREQIESTSINSELPLAA